MYVEGHQLMRLCCITADLVVSAVVTGINDDDQAVFVLRSVLTQGIS